MSDQNTTTIANGVNITGGCYSVNGTCISTGGAGNPAGSTGQLQSGNITNTAGRYMEIGNSEFYTRDQGYTGTFDDVRIYNRALSANEIATLYYMGFFNHFNLF